jgi:hypothetical protein
MIELGGCFAGREKDFGWADCQDIVPAVFREPVTDLDSLVVVAARMTDE